MLRTDELGVANTTSYDWWLRENNSIYVQPTASGHKITVTAMMTPEYTADTQEIEIDTMDLENIIFGLKADLELTYGEYAKFDAMNAQYEKRREMYRNKPHRNYGNGTIRLHDA
jgi:hypothetical protein